MNLLEGIDEVRGCLDAPPANEAQTCEWAVVPLLRATGYSSREIHAQTRDAGDKLPDYTVLPGDANEWFLEVKMWDAILEGKPEIQATTYAHTAGKRWAALTNGRVWRVYDDHIPGLPKVKLIAEARLDEPDFAEFLEAIGRGSVTASGMDGVRAWARAKREKEDERKKEEHDRTTRAKVLAEMLPGRLTSEDDELIDGMCAILVQDNALAGLTPSELAQYFCDTTPGIVQPAHVLPGDEYVSSVPLPIRSEIGNQGRQIVIDALRQVGITAEASESGCVRAVSFETAGRVCGQSELFLPANNGSVFIKNGQTQTSFSRTSGSQRTQSELRSSR